MIGPMTGLDRCDLLCLDLEMAERVRQDLPAADALEGRAASARALGDRTRLRLALALAAAGRACVCDLAWIAGRDERLVSHHLRRLKRAGLATGVRDGKLVMYELTPVGLAMLAASVGVPA